MKNSWFWIVIAFVLTLQTPAFAVDDAQANKDILKKAIQGAVTGAVAVEGSKETAKPAETAAAASVSDSDNDEHGHKHRHHGKPKQNFNKKHKGHRPPGWDKGKKTGWGDSDVPPGLVK